MSRASCSSSDWRCRRPCSATCGSLGATLEPREHDLGTIVPNDSEQPDVFFPTRRRSGLVTDHDESLQLATLSPAQRDGFHSGGSVLVSPRHRDRPHHLALLSRVDPRPMMRDEVAYPVIVTEYDGGPPLEGCAWWPRSLPDMEVMMGRFPRDHPAVPCPTRRPLADPPRRART